MFLNVATTVTLIASCFGEELWYDERTSEEAISTLKFKRDDVPISYKYSAIHLYSTQKPNDENVLPNEHQLAAIQYAPIYNNEKDTKNSTTYTKLDPRLIYNAKSKNYKKLEPREPSLGVQNIPSVKYFVPGHNIELPRPPKQIPEYNLVYSNHPNNIKGVHNEINLSRQLTKNEIVKVEDTIPSPAKVRQPLMSGMLQHDPFTWIFAETKSSNTNKFRKGETGHTTDNILPLTTHHTHRKRINVARMNGRRQVIAKEIIIGDNVLNNYGKVQNKGNVKNAVPPYSEIMNLLYPARRQVLQKLS